MAINAKSAPQKLNTGADQVTTSRLQMCTLAFCLEAAIAVLRYFSTSTCGARLYTAPQILCYLAIAYAQNSVRLYFSCRLASTFRLMQQALHLTLEVLSFLDAEHGRHSHQRYTAQYSVLFSERSYYKQHDHSYSNYKKSKSNYFILAVLRREKLRYSLILCCGLAVLLVWHKTDERLQKSMQHRLKLKMTLLVVSAALYYLDVIPLAVPGYWPYVRSLVPAFFCGKLAPQLGGSLQIQAAPRSAQPTKILLILLESFPTLYCLKNSQLDPTHMPFLASYASKNQLFTNVYSNSIPTANALFGIFSQFTAQQRTLSIVNHFDHEYKNAFFELREQGYETLLYLPYHSFFDKLDSFGYIFNETIDGIGPSLRNKYKWAPDRVRSAEILQRMTENASAKQLVVYSTAEAHFPFTGFDDAEYYDLGGESRFENVLRYLDGYIKRLVSNLPPDTFVIITGDHGNGFSGRDAVECKFGTIGIVSGPAKVVQRPTTHAYLLSPIYGFAGVRQHQSMLIQDGFSSMVLENDALRNSSWRERYSNDCEIQRSNARGGRAMYAVWAIEYLQLLFIYNNIFVGLSIYEIQWVQRPVIIKQRYNIRYN